MIEIRLASVDEMLTNGQTLFERHWHEIALNKELMQLKPDAAKYKQIEEAGNMLILSAHEGGQLIGYSVNFIINHLHYSDLVLCQNDLLFLIPEKRSGRIGLKLILETEKHAQDRGAHMVIWHAKQGTALTEILPKLGYGIQDIMFSKGI